jgi:hypothetical protein
MPSLFGWRRRRSASQATRRPRARLAVEALEARDQPATTVAPDLLTQWDTGHSAHDDITQEARPAFAGTTTSPYGTIIWLYIDHAAVTSTIITGNGGGPFKLKPPQPLEDGVHTAQFFDSKTRALSAPLTFTVDNAPPAISSLEVTPADLSPNGDGVQDEGTLRFHLSESATVQVDFLDDAGESLGSIPVGALDSGAHEFQLTVPQFPEGTYTLSINAVDDANNRSVPATVTFVIDLTPPEPPTAALSPGSDTGPSRDDGITAASSLTFIGTAEAGTVVDLAEGDVWLGDAVAGDDGTWSITVSLLDGMHTLAAYSTDAAGNSSLSEAIVVTVDTRTPEVVVPNQPPTLTVPTARAVSRNSAVVAGPSLAVADVDSSWVTARVTIDRGSIIVSPIVAVTSTFLAGTSSIQFAGPVDALNASLANLSFSFGGGDIGVATVTVEITDAADGFASNAAPTTGSFQITVVNRAPQVVTSGPSYTVIGNTALDVASPGLLAAFRDADSDLLTVQLVTGPSVGVLSLNANGSFRYTPPPGFVGTVRFTIRAFDGIDWSVPLDVVITVTNPYVLRRSK